MTVRVFIGDCRARLAELPDESVHCVVTSPPYFGLRDYGVDGQIGLEATPDAYVGELVAVFREVWRVLRDDGTVWLNLGDSYANTPVGTFNGGGFRDGANRQERYDVGHRTSGILNKFKASGLKQKDLIGIPWRVAFALQSDGWYLRQDIIWSKPNPMPESVQDRCTKAHEYVFLLSKQERYWYDAEAISEDAIRAGDVPGGSRKHTSSSVNDGRVRQGLEAHSLTQVGETRNKRSVWTIATRPFSESHFAAMPPALAEICIKAGCPPGGTVLDPFGGAGTTGMVAARLLRDAILIELNPDYADMAKRRIFDDFGLFTPIHLEHVVEAAE